CWQRVSATATPQPLPTVFAVSAGNYQRTRSDFGGNPAPAPARRTKEQRRTRGILAIGATAMCDEIRIPVVISQHNHIVNLDNQRKADQLISSGAAVKSRHQK